MTPFKIIKNRKPLSSEEMQKQMDFDKFIKGHKPMKSFNVPKKWLFAGATVVTVAAIVAVMNTNKGNDPKKISKDSTRNFVAPPVPQMDIQSDGYTISGNSDTVINCPSGTKIFVPANSFVDKDNKPVAGPYTIYFREFRDQYDQLLSGIPMSYDSAGVTYQFESAGMFDIGGTKHGEKIFIAPGKELTVDMPCKDPTNKFNVYYLDTVAKNWSYDRDNSLNNRLLAAGVDSLLHKKYNTGIESIVVPKVADPNLDNVMIDFNKDEFPELAIFKGIKFELTDRNVKVKDGVNDTWEDVSVSRKDHGRYLIEFTKGDVSKSFVTVPVLEKNELEANFAAYDQLRIKRISNLKAISDSLNSLRSAYEREHEQTKDVNAGITKLVREGQFLSALNDYMTMETAKLLTRSGTISRMAVIRRFGIYNFDCAGMMWGDPLVKKEEKKIIPAHYYVNGRRIESQIEDAYLIKRDFNGTFKLKWAEIFNFPAKEGASADILIVVTNNKQMYYIKDEDFKAIDLNAKDIAFNLKAAPADIKSPIKLREFLEM